MARLKSGPLSGLKVIDLTHVMAGPTCTLLLADLGAEIIKVERPPEGDDSRHMAPPFIGTESAAYLMMNRNKKGIVVDLKTDSGRDVLRRLATASDVLVENYRIGALEKLGLSYETLSKENPRLIWCSISGYGRTGPYAHKGGFDLMAQAMSGLMSFTGEGPERPPVKLGAPVADITAGILGAFGILAAVNHRHETGRGQKVDTSLFEAAILHTFWQSAMTFATGISPKPAGTAHPLDGPYQAFQTRDGWVVIGAANQRNWLRLLEALNRQDIASDTRFASNPARMRNLKPLIEVLDPIFQREGTSFWCDCLEEHGVPVAPILTVGEMHHDPQAIARGMIEEVEHTTLGKIRTLGHPVKFSETPAELGAGAPLLGEHTREVLYRHGYTEAEVQLLVSQGAIFASDTACK